MAKDQKLPHILAFPFPIPGHMNSLMYVCKRLVSSCGLKITYISNQDNYKLMLQTRDLVEAGTPTTQQQQQPEILVLDDGLSGSEGSSKPNPSENLEKPGLAALGMRGPLEELIQKLQDEGNPVACILTDTFNGWIQDVANKFSIPRALFWTSNAINDIIHMYLPQLVSRGFVPVVNRKTNELVDFLPGFPPIPATDLPLSFYFDHPIIEVISDGARRVQEAEYVLCNTFEELEPHSISAIRKEIRENYYYPVGPCISPAFFQSSKSLSRSPELLSPEDLACLSWLDSQQESSVIYVSFGSVATMSGEQIQDFALGLEQAGCHFLLVVRKTLVSDPSVHDFFKGFSERTQDRGLIISWAPQMHVLLHPSVGGFLTHCGWNSITEAICAGVPMLAWPCMAEQNVNCKELVQRWGIAIEMKVNDEEYVGGRVSDKTVARLVRKLMIEGEGDEMRARAGEFRKAAIAAVGEGGSSDRNLKEFAAAIKGRIAST